MGKLDLFEDKWFVTPSPVSWKISQSFPFFYYIGIVFGSETRITDFRVTKMGKPFSPRRK